MPKIDGSGPLVDALRAQISTRLEAQRPQSTKPTASDGSIELERLPVSIEELRVRIGKEIKRLDLSTTNGKRQARFAFLEAVLSHELGAHLPADAEFSHVVRDVEASLAGDPRVVARLDDLLRRLADGSSN